MGTYHIYNVWAEGHNTYSVLSILSNNVSPVWKDNVDQVRPVLRFKACIGIEGGDPVKLRIEQRLPNHVIILI